MNFRYLSHKLAGLTLAFVLLTGITFFSATEASAQRIVRRPGVVRSYRVYRPYYRPYYRTYRPFGFYNYGWYGDSFYNPYSQYIFDNSEDASQAAYKQGYKTGEEDGRKRKSFSYERSHYFKEAGFGNFGEVYRRGFSRGYQVGYQAGAARAS